MGSIRDPIHGFVEYDQREEVVINSEAFQRLRFIGQLATTQWLYPGAKHSRFEHSIGVMEVATRVFDKIWKRLVHIVPDWEDDRDGLRKRLRLGALLHDIGHPAFSHAFEEVLPKGSHEYYTGRYILEDDELQDAFREGGLGIYPEDIAAIALGPEEKAAFFPGLLDSESSQLQFLNQILTSDLLGADRMDYLLRDSHHAGVTYGHFDLERVLDTITVVEDEAGNPQLALELGGREAAEGMILARYYMSTQVYYHRVRRVLDEWIRRAIRKVFQDTDRYEDLKHHRRLTDDVVQVRVRDEWLQGNCQEGAVFFRREHPRLAYSVPNDVLEKFRASDQMRKLRRSLERYLSRRVNDPNEMLLKSVDKESVGASVRDVAVVFDLAGSEEHRPFGSISRVLKKMPRIQAINVYAIDLNERVRIKKWAEEWECDPRTLPGQVA